MDQKWLLLQLSDSALPTGGFIASSGLEVSTVIGKVKDTSSLLCFLKQSIDNHASLNLAFLRAAFEAECIDRILELDKLLDGFMNGNLLAKQTMRSQGHALLNLVLVSFLNQDGVSSINSGTNTDNSDNSKLLVEMKRLGRDGSCMNYFTIVFGVCLKALKGISMADTTEMFLFLHARSIVSAAIRLNLVGPFQGQSILLQCQSFCHSSADRWRDHSIQHSAQTCPILELFQSKHSQLYSRLFNS